MPTNLPRNRAFDIPPGTMVTGKWHGKQYQIIKPLGSGGQGAVFLAHSERGRVALKFSTDQANIASEVNVLNKFSKVRGDSLGPSLYDVDDWTTGRGTFAFYAMEYIRGTPLLECVRVRGFEWAPIFILQLLKDLDKLHREGWVFGDLKPENLIVTGPPLKVRWLDVGGTTPMGRAIKEYTEFFDRGYWGMGTRKAEPSYDLFAVAMIMINLADMRRFEKGDDPKKQLLTHVMRHRKLAPFYDEIKGALTGAYPSAAAMRADLLNKTNGTIGSDDRITNRKTRTKKKKEWKGTVILACAVLFAYFMYVAIFMM